jgi:hypothetical protein
MKGQGGARLEILSAQGEKSDTRGADTTSENVGRGGGLPRPALLAPAKGSTGFIAAR